MTRLKRFLRSPKTITGELLVILAASLARALVPQVRDGAAHERFAHGSPWLYAIAHSLGLDRALRTPWFLAALVLAALSLLVVLREQLGRLVREWPVRSAEAAFHRAPYRVEFEREARAGGGGPAFHASGRIAMLGSPLFHAGLLVLVAAGVVHALFATYAATGVYEGETLDPAASFEGQWPSLAGRRFSLPVPVRLDRLEPRRHRNGDLDRLDAVVTVRGDGDEARRIGVNEPLRWATRSLYVSQTHGPALVARLRSGTSVDDLVLLMREVWPGRYEADERLASGLRVQMRASIGPDARLPGSVDVRATREGVLQLQKRLPIGQEVELAPGDAVGISGIRYWVRLDGEDDPARSLAYAGFFLVVLGAALMFLLVRVDSAIVVTPTAKGERVLVALRPHRFAPLYAERFERMVREQGGSTGAP